MSQWWRDFSYKKGVFTVKTTGAQVPFNWANTKDTLTWFSFYALEVLRALPRRWSKPLAQIYSVPARPRAWYLFWAVAHRAGCRFTPDPAAADLYLAFSDQTHSALTPPDTDKPAINFACRDISKSHVAKTFEQVFGYSLTVNPATHHGPMVAKTEENGAHSGKIIEAPCLAEPGLTYQRVIDNVYGDVVSDLRCVTIGGQVALIFIKRRPMAQRFANLNSSCSLGTPAQHLSDEERAKISDFCAAMGLDFGGLDVLRDRGDGRIYIVDVNKTDMGPPIALPLRDKLRATGILARALQAYLNSVMGSGVEPGPKS